MASQDTGTAPAPDNANKPGVGANKGDLRPGDIQWVTPPPPPPSEPATKKALSKGQARDLARRIRAKLARKG